MSDRDGSFREFVMGTRARLLNFAVFLVGDQQRAEDLLQDAYLAAYVKWPRIERRSPEAYVRRCIVNGRTDWWRRRSSSETPTDTLTAVASRTTGDSTSDVDAQQLVFAALNRLTRRERTVIVMRFYIGLSESEIATELGLAPGTVKSTASRAVHKLRDDHQLREDVARDIR